MATLEAFLQSDAVINLSDADALAYGNETVVLSTDSTAYTWSGIGQALLQGGLDPQLVVGMRDILKDVQGFSMLDGALLSGGFDFSDTTNRYLIGTLISGAGTNAAAILSAMLGVGQTSGARWEQQGIDQPTVEDIAAARVAISNEQAIQSFSTLCQYVIGEWRNGNISNLTQAKALITEG